VLEGERKQVTVLFADVKGSMELAEHIDPEELHATMDRFFGILADGVHRYEGTVNQYTGDGIMALFGAPVAHEDHAERACRAALELRDRLRRYSEEQRRTRGLAFEVRIGLNSGEVVVGKIGDDLRMDYTAQGRTVGLAARIEQLAYPGSVYLTEDTASLVEGYFRLRDLGEFDLKGARGPVRVFELEDVGPFRTRLDSSRARGFSRFVGRAAEIERLEARLREALEGKGRVVGVVGEAGVGKSRLCVEFLERCRARGAVSLWGHGVPYGQGVPFLPVLELLRDFFGITARDGDEASRAKIAGRVLLLEESLRDGLPLLFDFLGVADPERPAPAMDPEARQRRLYAMVKRLVRARSLRESMVVLLEDLHWFDQASDELVGGILEEAAEGRGLWVVNFRPEYGARWMGAPFYEQIDLRPLGPEAVGQLLDDLLGGDASLRDLAMRIAERTGGNPFFIEEVVRSLVETADLEGEPGAYRAARPLEQLSIPARVQSVLASRIDRLPEREKRTLLTAAVIGQRFSEAVLRDVLEGAEVEEVLGVLEQAGFLFEEPTGDERRFAFLHPLTREVAYGAQLAEPRSRVHAAVANAMKRLYADRLDEQAALVAHHFEGAREPLEAARWHRRAATWLGRASFAESLRHWGRVRELLQPLPQSAETDSLRLESCIQMLLLHWRLGASEEAVAEVFKEGKGLAERLGDLARQARLHALYGVARGVLFADVAGYVEHTGEATELAERSQDEDVLPEVLLGRIVALEFAGRLKEALTASNLVLDTEAVGGEESASRLATLVFLRIRRGHLWCYLGRFAEAERDLERGLEIARSIDNAELAYWAHSGQVVSALLRGDGAAILTAASRCLELAEKLDLPFLRSNAQEVLGVAHVLREEWGEAVETLERVLSMPAEGGVFRIDESTVYSYLAIARAGRGDAAGARCAAEKALSIAQQRGTPYQELQAWLALGWVILWAEGAGTTTELGHALERASELLRVTGAAGVEPLLRLEQAEMARLDGDGERHARRLRDAHGLLQRMGAAGHAERLAARLASLGIAAEATPSA
jgi:class 3 adenylate cyclase/tetratricopeptide (TPR) repeat protein